MRRLSSSTRQVPLGSRTRSMPPMWMRTFPTGRTPRSWGNQLFEASTRSRRHRAVGEDPLVAVDVGQEELEGPHPLHQPALQRRPVGGRDHARHQAEGEDLLGAPLVGVDREGDALVEQRPLRQPLADREAGAGVHAEGVDGLAEGRAGRSTFREELVPGAGESPVVGEERRGGVHGGSGVSQVGRAAGRRRRSRVRRAEGARKGLRKRPGRTTTRSRRRSAASAASAGSTS